MAFGWLEKWSRGVALLWRKLGPERENGPQWIFLGQHDQQVKGEQKTKRTKRGKGAGAAVPCSQCGLRKTARVRAHQKCPVGQFIMGDSGSEEGHVTPWPLAVAKTERPRGIAYPCSQLLHVEWGLGIQQGRAHAPPRKTAQGVWGLGVCSRSRQCSKKGGVSTYVKDKLYHICEYEKWREGG